MPKRGEKMSAKTKARISASQKKSYASGTRRKVRTKAQIIADNLNARLRELEERERRLEYLERADAKREQYAALDEAERTRLEDEAWNKLHGCDLPKGIRSLGHGRAIPRRICSNKLCTCRAFMPRF